MSQGSQDRERQRVPQPLLKRRLISGRGAMEQPNATHDGAAALSLRFWMALLATSVLTGLFGISLMWILNHVELWAFHYHSGDYTQAVAATSRLRRLTSLVLAGFIGGGSWYVIRRMWKSEKSEIDDAVWHGDARLGVRRSVATSVVSEVVIGMGASIGREAAPKLMGGLAGSVIAQWMKLSLAQRRLLVACGGGAGLACVYNVPLGGALFTAEVFYGSLSLPTVLPALASSLIATWVGWLYLPTGATYADIPVYRCTASLEVWSLVAGAVIGLLGVFYVRLIGLAAHYRIKGIHLFWAMPLAFGVLGVIGFWYPELFGNGKDMGHTAFIGAAGLGLMGILFVLKPLVTALTLSSGSAGGVFTPMIATGAVFGAFAGGLWNHWWPGTPIGAFALVGAAAMISSTMQAPLAGFVLVLELTHSGFNLAIPMGLAIVVATLIVRQVDGYSIYSARLPRVALDPEGTVS